MKDWPGTAISKADSFLGGERRPQDATLVFLTLGRDGGDLVGEEIFIRERGLCMNRTSLDDSLRNLRAELASIEPDDELARDSLAKLDAEIHRVLQAPGRRDAGPRARPA